MYVSLIEYIYLFICYIFVFDIILNEIGKRFREDFIFKCIYF